MNPTVKRIHPDFPVFRIDHKTDCVLYTPGKSINVAPSDADRIESLWTRGEPPGNLPLVRHLARWLETHARQAAQAWHQQNQSPFQPECLTLYLSNACNLTCLYCFAAEEGDRQVGSLPPMTVIREAHVLAAACLVAQCCAHKGRPFSLVVHGGGEPTLHWEAVKKYETITRRMADRYGISWKGHIATNGVLSEDNARWLARHFTTIGLSCDGPPEIQDRQRPFGGQSPTSLLVERSARAMRAAGANIEVRATITPQTMTRQVEIMTYLHEHLGATRIRFEPVYRLTGKKMAGFRPADADLFVTHYLAAQNKARALSCHLSFSGVRLNDLHGPFCDAARQTLHLTPDGTATACFFCTHTEKSDGAGYRIGSPDASSEAFVLRETSIRRHRRAAARIPDLCQTCINIFHCARGCPELCCTRHDATRPVDNDAAHFRCRVNKGLALRWILASCGLDTELSPARRPPALGAADTWRHPLKRYLSTLPASLNTAAIARQWTAIRGKYAIERSRMPAPIWAERGYEDCGDKSWVKLKSHITRSPAAAPMAIYLHIPFCTRRCGFCDCYSIALGKNKARKDEKYTRTLLSEIETVSQLHPISRRPVSTIHFGGGTPNCLRPDLFESIIQQCKTRFNMTAQTEWALESTGALISRDHLSHLRQLGFKRLHVGVQTLEEPLRASIGRQVSSAVVLNRLVQAMRLGFITSVDVIYGLPGQTFQSLYTTLKRLVHAGLHGISLYRLNESKRNAWFLDRFRNIKRDIRYRYVLFQMADQFLTASGYQKNHFVHYALAEDHNAYAGHARRGEDLLALGATADGVFGPYHYRHPGYAAYVTRSKTGRPALEGGILENEKERALRPAIAAVMCGGITSQALEALHAQHLLAKWIDCGLLCGTSRQRQFALSANGSWFVNEMIAELKGALSSSSS